MRTDVPSNGWLFLMGVAEVVFILSVLNLLLTVLP